MSTGATTRHVFLVRALEGRWHSHHLLLRVGVVPHVVAVVAEVVHPPPLALHSHLLTVEVSVVFLRLSAPLLVPEVATTTVHAIITTISPVSVPVGALA